MPEQHDDILEHDYDGIKEQNNKMPRWWVWMFIISIFWAVGYFTYFHVLGIGYSQADQYRKEMNPNYTRAASDNKLVESVLEPYHSPYYSPEKDNLLNRATATKPKAAYVEQTRESDTTIYVALTAPEEIADGKAIFESKCVSCHGKFAEGNIGPNLTDDYWLHGGGISNIVKTIKYGVPAKGMLSWQGELKPQQILQTASYILSLHGSHPPNAKAPQGDLAAGP
jgi:cytochrome c oxidase cbb3-type subunit III